jgi:hypothetical protein
MRVGLPTALLGFVLSAGVAAGQTAGQTAQQELMRACNAHAGARNLTGEARWTFMSQCLAGRATPSARAAMTPGSPTPAQAAQQERMRTCNAEVGTRNLAGEARQRFMSDCLAGRAGAEAPAGAGAQGSGGGTPRPN